MRKKATENGEYIRKKVKEAEKNEAEETARAEEDRLSRFKPFDASLASKKPSVASITGWFAGTWGNGANTAWSDGSIADLYGEPGVKGWETRKDNKRTTPDVDRVIPRNSNDPFEPVGMYDGKVGQTKGGDVLPDGRQRSALRAPLRSILHVEVQGRETGREPNGCSTDRTRCCCS